MSALQEFRRSSELFAWGLGQEQELSSDLFAQQPVCLFWVPKVTGKSNSG